uniref:J domain-containing protein n=1 Tax=Bosea sp. NBC_00436 TaxID=2969620 RepID=A0A9E7ZJ82_9HYPH
MRTLLVLAALGWAMSLPWAALFGYIVLIVVAIVILWFLSASIERHAVSPRRDRKIIDHNYVAALEAMVAQAEAEAKILRAELQRFRSAATAPEPDAKAALFGRVGLSPAAPEWLISAARRAYRAALHPDGHPVHRKQEATRRFQLAESVFDEIASSR